MILADSCMTGDAIRSLTVPAVLAVLFICIAGGFIAWVKWGS
jgi:hypothetical protein